MAERVFNAADMGFDLDAPDAPSRLSRTEAEAEIARLEALRDAVEGQLAERRAIAERAEAARRSYDTYLARLRQRIAHLDRAATELAMRGDLSGGTATLAELAAMTEIPADLALGDLAFYDRGTRRRLEVNVIQSRSAGLDPYQYAKTVGDLRRLIAADGEIRCYRRFKTTGAWLRAGEADRVVVALPELARIVAMRLRKSAA